MRKKHEEHSNHEAWAIPYADLMTLLLAFFVVMYAVSVVNEGKYRVASQSMIEAFHGSSRALAPLAPGKAAPHTPEPSMSRPISASGASLAPVNVPLPQRRMPSQSAARQVRPAADLRRLEDRVRKALQPLINKRMVAVRRGPGSLEIEIRTDVLFPSGVAQLSVPATAVLRNMAAILAPFGNPLRVEGFTDDVPIATAMYPSNWELSAARAATVARLFAEHGVRPDRLGIVGWGDVRPIADNSSAEGRNQNRRVLVVVMGGQDPPERPVQDLDQLQAGSQLTAAAGSSAPHRAPVPAPMATQGGARVSPATAAPAPERAPMMTTPTRDASVVSSVRQTADPAPDTGYAPATLAR
ncbi:MAG TPA: flagellar motor protein MotD [Rhodanobacter sp.]